MLKTLPIPVSSASWWFVTTYVLVVLFAPLLNRLVDNVNNKGVFVLIIYFGILYGICGFETAYYNILRAPFYYLAGAFIKRRNIKLGKIYQQVFALFLVVAVWLFYSLVRYLQIIHIYDTVAVWKAFAFLADYLMSGILIPIIAISLFLFIASLNFSNGFVNKIASTTFAVYLLHDSNIGRKIIWNEIVCPEKTQFPLVWYQYALLSIATVVAIFTVCSFVDILRQIIFEKKMDKMCDAFVGYFKEKCCMAQNKEIIKS